MPDFSKDDRGQTDITAPVELLADEVEAVVGGNGGVAGIPTPDGLVHLFYKPDWNPWDGSAHAG